MVGADIVRKSRKHAHRTLVCIDNALDPRREKLGSRNANVAARSPLDEFRPHGN